MPSIDIPSHSKEERHRSKEEKKRKRDCDEEAPVKHKSKKHRSEESKTIDIEAPAVATPNEPQESPFHLQTSTQYLPLAPVSQRHPIEGICAEHFSPLLLTYYPPLHGVVISYSNVRISQNPYGSDGPEALLKSVDEYGASWAWVTADFLLFKPVRGATLEGHVNLQNEGHIGVVCWNLFNASIESKRLPKDWKWVETADAEGAEYEEPHYVDGAGKKVEGMVKFRVKDMECSHDRQRGFLSIEGTMLGDTDENILLTEEAERARKEKRVPGRRLGGARALGATSLAVATEEEKDERPKRGRDF